MTNLIGIEAPNADDTEDKIPKIDQERLGKVFEVAKNLNAKHRMETIWLEDVLEWGLITYKVMNTHAGPQEYQTINFLDTYTVKEHVELIKKAFGEAQAQVDKDTAKANKTQLIMTGSNA